MWQQSFSAILLYVLLSCGAPTSAACASALLSPQSKDKQKVNVYQLYDKSKDVTKLQTVEMVIYGMMPGEPVPGMDNGGLSMKAFFTYSGTAPVSPTSINIEFRSNKGEHRYNRTLTITADDERFDLGDMTLTPKLGAVLTLTATLSPDAFRRIAGALKVKIEIGNDGFTLTGQQLANLSALAMLTSR